MAAIPPDTSALHAKRYQLRHLKASIAKKKARLSRFLQTEQQLRKQIPQASGYAKEKLISRLQDLQKQIKAVKIDETPLFEKQFELKQLRSKLIKPLRFTGEVQVLRFVDVP